MILLDMVGDRDLNLTLPADTPSSLLNLLARIAEKHLPSLRYGKVEHNMLDDHVPFQKQGIPAIDLIDFDYGPQNSYWHTSGDTLDHISAESIKTVADLAFALIWNAPSK